ncbi:IS4 family transposase [Synoicihabitans lomoniglobus]|uniref:IS4 family transposase n=1 Tax=Synoicihabitans lomoniglobus TaxID=2909285 RepID=A0AAE9ZU94_9BACT|nr:IS4 family transposase [Opitutaceae bacterium LMO-M01]WED64411.1 IS4 family transposase [Opitutaceae bacterium LMO-M01]
MKINTLYLPGFCHRLCGSSSKRGAGALSGRALKLDGLAALLARFIAPATFAGVGKRDRIYTPWVTFCAFLGQVLQRGASCRDAVRRVQAWHLKAGSATAVDDATGGYCQARSRLPIAVLRTAFNQLAEMALLRSRTEDQWLGHTVKVIDGGGLSMPDTAANRKVYPYAGGQRKGCGFPTGQMVGLFSLATGHLVKFVLSSWKAHEAPLARQLIGWVKQGEVLLADRGFCNWGLISLLHRKGVDVVMRLHQARRTGTGEVCWPKPQRQGRWGKCLWNELPQSLTLRVVRFRAAVPGFRTDRIAVVTTLLDEAKYPDAVIAELYLRRWQVELHFRDIKTTLGLDVLRTQTPEMIEKEVHLQAIAYNVVRLLMLEAARQHDVPPARLSFKGTVSTLRAFAPLFATNARQAAQRFEELLLALAADLVPDRPHRSEPRAIKRRPKVYQLMTKPRHHMRVSISRRQ